MGAIITTDSVASLVSDGVRESRVIEYKRDRVGGSDGDKKEFLADVAAFANAIGGTILYGIDEVRDSDGKPTGIPREATGVSIDNSDAEIRRLTEIIRTGISPRLSGVAISSIDGFPQGPVLAIEIPRSHRAPHMVTFQSSSRFYSRVSTGRHPLDIDEIRDAFFRAEDLPARIRAFRSRRIQVLQDGESPVPLDAGPLVVVQIVPLGTFSDHTAIPFSDIISAGKAMRLVGFSSFNHAINLDGHLAWAPVRGAGQKHAVGYLQVFRDGSIEAVDGLAIPPGTEAEGGVSPAVLETLIVRQVLDYARHTASMPIGDSLAIMVTLLNAKGYRVTSSDRYDAHILDRQVIAIPDGVIARDNLTSAAPLKQILDMLWQACGFSHSPYFSDSGEWTNPGRTG